MSIQTARGATQVSGDAACQAVPEDLPKTRIHVYVLQMVPTWVHAGAHSLEVVLVTTWHEFMVSYLIRCRVSRSLLHCISQLILALLSTCR
jgi:hypothetical protein